MLLSLMVGVAFAQSNDPARPFPNHEQPPEGWYCVPAQDQHALETEAHACACRGMNMEAPTDDHCPTMPTYDDDGNQTGEELVERSTCKVYCHKSHCHCRSRCEST
jgi:hypothetical protein